MYDFHKKNRSTNECIFYHNNFQRGRPDLLNAIKRKTNSQFAAFNVRFSEGPTKSNYGGDFETEGDRQSSRGITPSDVAASTTVRSSHDTQSNKVDNRVLGKQPAPNTFVEPEVYKRQRMGK